MLRFLIGLFVSLHGLVHLLYFAQSQRYFELQPGMTWPDGSWTFSRLLGDGATRSLASVALIVAALIFLAGGAGILARQAWWRPVVLAAAVISGVFYLLLWNGKLQGLDNQGGIGLLINLAILVAVLVLRWPKLGF